MSHYPLALVVGTQRLTSYVAQRAAETLDQSSGDIDIEVVSETATDLPVTGDLLDEDYKPLLPVTPEKETPQVEEFELSPIAELMRDSSDLGHIAYCEDCGWKSTPKDSEVNANRALAMHRRSCDVCNEIEVTQ